MNLHAQRDGSTECLNESPPEKEGKSASARFTGGTSGASMKALPKRKGNPANRRSSCAPHAPQ